MEKRDGNSIVNASLYLSLASAFQSKYTMVLYVEIEQSASFVLLSFGICACICVYVRVCMISVAFKSIVFWMALEIMYTIKTSTRSSNGIEITNFTTIRLKLSIRNLNDCEVNISGAILCLFMWPYSKLCSINRLEIVCKAKS